MTLLNLTKYELRWRVREPLTFCFIVSPIFFLALLVFGLVPERLVDFYGVIYHSSEALFCAFIQIASIIWLVLIVCVITKNYNDRIIFFCLPANRFQLWTAKVMSLHVISAFYFINLTLIMYIANMVAAVEIAISPLSLLLMCLSSGGALMILLALSAHVRNKFLFVVLSYFVILVPTYIKSISGYFIGNFMRLGFINCGNIPEPIECFFKYYLPIYYILFFFLGYFGYRNMRISHEI